MKHALVSAAAALLLQAPAAALAGDRPFLATDSAAAEEDDDNVWSVASWFERRGREHALTVAPEYAFNPTTSVQVEFAAARDRDAGTRGRALEFEVKHLFNHIARDGYGWGAVLGLGWEKAGGEGWRRGSVTAKLPFTIALWQGEGALHFNAGVEKPRGEKRENLFSIGLEREVARRTVLFAEAAREGDTRLLHGGLRWWAKREKIAIDLSVLREKGGGERRSGVVLGLALYDL